MNFAEIRFWGYLFVALGLVLAIRFPVSKWRREGLGLFDKFGLAFIGIFLLGCVSLQTLVIFGTVSFVTFVGLRLILHFVDSVPKRKKWLFVLVPFQLLPLIWYKYANFIGNEVLRLDQASFAQLAIPVGISFYTFQLVAFSVDTLVRHQPLPSAVTALNFAGFFPQIVAGPIERRDSLLPQLTDFRFRWNREAFEEGLTWIVVGLFFKRCLADNLALMALQDPGTNAYLVWLNTLLFGFRIYFDFCGYSLLALGVAICFGLKLTLNFRSPYCSTNITEFWRRWHVTLSTWFRDYIYIPLGGSRTRLWALNVMIVFVVSGIWHGAGWNFIFWGGLHGVFLIVHRLSPWWRGPKFVNYLLTHVAVFFAWLCFYETDTGELIRKISLLVNPFSYAPGALKEGAKTLASASGFNILAFLAMSFLVVFLERLSLGRSGEEPYRVLRNRFVLVLLVAVTVVLAPTADNEFIYFAF